MCAVPGVTVPALRSQQQLDENSPLGDLLGGVLDVPSCQIGECPEGQRRCRALYVGFGGWRDVGVCLQEPLCLLQLSARLRCVLVACSAAGLGHLPGAQLQPRSIWWLRAALGAMRSCSSTP